LEDLIDALFGCDFAFYYDVHNTSSGRATRISESTR
jgi:hypothetical protein